MMPIILTIIGCALGAGLVKARWPMVGVGFIGSTSSSTAVWYRNWTCSSGDDLHRFGLTLNVIDVGWASRCSNCTRHYHWLIPLALIVNLLLVSWLNFTQTVNVDIWKLPALRIRRPLCCKRYQQHHAWLRCSNHRRGSSLLVLRCNRKATSRRH